MKDERNNKGKREEQGVLLMILLLYLVEIVIWRIIRVKCFDNRLSFDS